MHSNFEPQNNQFPPTKSLPSFFGFFLKQQWRRLILLQLAYFGWAIDATLFPCVFRLIIDAISSVTGDKSQMWPTLAIPLILGASLWIGLAFAYRSAGFLNSKVTPQLEASVRMSMFNYVQKHSYNYFSNNLAGNLSNKISDMATSTSYILDLYMRIFFPFVLAIIIASTLFMELHPLFAGIFLIWLTIHLTISLTFARRCERYSDDHAEAKSTLSGKIVDSLINNMNVKLFSRHKLEYDYINKYQTEEQIKHEKSLRYIEYVRIALDIGGFLFAGIAINWFVFTMWQKDAITNGDVVFIFNATWNMLMLSWVAGMELPRLFKEIGVCKQALSLIRIPHDIVDSPDARPLTVTKGEIVFDNVHFCYRQGKNIFEEKSIAIEPGAKVGLVGFSGSGKSTFVNLILRFFDVQSGKILLDGQDISKVTQESLRNQIALIPQEPILFHRSLMENIRYGRPHASDEDVIRASIQANCHEFICGLKDGYNTLVGERGIKLSGGQRQRIAIARAILKNAPILLLDEATSALDSVTEHFIQESLSSLMKNRTTIAIAHRLSTLFHMDRILVFDDGYIVEDGTHDELIALNGHYARLWNMQAGGFIADE